VSKSRNYSGNTTNSQNITADNSLENQKTPSLSCPKCAATKIARSRPQGLDNLSIRFLPRRPYRCMHCYHRFWYRESFTADKRRLWSWALLVVAIALVVALSLQTSSRPSSIASGFSTKQSSILDTRTSLPGKTNSITELGNSGEAKLSNVEKRDLMESMEFLYPPTNNRSPVSEAELKRQVVAAKQKEMVVQKISQQKQAVLSDQLRAQPAEIQSLLKTDISYRVEQWRSAWQSGNSKRYLDFYDASYLPAINDSGKKISRKSWRQQRIARVVPEKQIQLNLSSFRVKFSDNNAQAVVSFNQEYRSNNYKDVSRKELTFTLRDEQWYIIAERNKTQ